MLFIVIYSKKKVLWLVFLRFTVVVPDGWLDGWMVGPFFCCCRWYFVVHILPKNKVNHNDVVDVRPIMKMAVTSFVRDFISVSLP